MENARMRDNADMREPSSNNTSPQANGPEPAPSRKKRVLLIDDDMDGAMTMGLMLRHLGYEVVTSNSGPDGLGWGEMLQPEVVLLDLDMPEMDGFETCRALRRTPWGARAKVIAVTGYGEEEDRQRSREAGFDVHLVKPVNPQTLDKELLQAPTLEAGPRRTL